MITFASDKEKETPPYQGAQSTKNYGKSKNYIKRQTTWNDTEKEEEETLFETTRKAEAEKYFYRIRKNRNYAYNIRMGYFKTDEFTMAGKVTNEYWIEKH